MRLKYLGTQATEDNVLKGLAATALSQCVAIHEGALLPINYYGQTVLAEVEHIEGSGHDDVSSPKGDGVFDLTARFKGVLLIGPLD